MQWKVGVAIKKKLFIYFILLSISDTNTVVQAHNFFNIFVAMMIGSERPEIRKGIEKKFQ